jgi:23S rRNA pseudouridine2605 synthase
VRLNKVLSTAGVASRRAADELIQQGRVEVNGRMAKTGMQVDPAADDIRVDGRRLKAAPERRYLLLNKPPGVVSTRSDPQRRPTVIDLLERAGVHGYFYPVGRLDYESEGLILLTNDGALAERVTHPRYELERTYEVTLVGVPDERDLRRLREGVPLDGRRTLPAKVRRLRVLEGREGPRALVEITLREGRNRQVRRMCDAIGHPADRLRRTRIGPVTDHGLKPGRFRDLTPAEIKGLLGGNRGRSVRLQADRSGPT